MVMAEMWKPKDQDLLRNWVEAILMEASDDLNDWEKNFISDMENRLDRGQRLTQLQEEKLEQIYAAKTS
jgi:hypothetical protein